MIIFYIKGSDQWKMRGGREAGKCSKVVPDRGDRCLFIFLWSRRLFCNVFPFPVCKAHLIMSKAFRFGTGNTHFSIFISVYLIKGRLCGMNITVWVRYMQTQSSYGGLFTACRIAIKLYRLVWVNIVNCSSGEQFLFSWCNSSDITLVQLL